MMPHGLFTRTLPRRELGRENGILLSPAIQAERAEQAEDLARMMNSTPPTAPDIPLGERIVTAEAALETARERVESVAAARADAAADLAQVRAQAADLEAEHRRLVLDAALEGRPSPKMPAALADMTRRIGVAERLVEDLEGALVAARGNESNRAGEVRSAALAHRFSEDGATAREALGELASAVEKLLGAIGSSAHPIVQAFATGIAYAGAAHAEGLGRLGVGDGERLDLANRANWPTARDADRLAVAILERTGRHGI